MRKTGLDDVLVPSLFCGILLLLGLQFSGCVKKEDPKSDRRRAIAEEKDRFATEHKAVWLERIWTNSIVQLTVDYQDTVVKPGKPVAFEILLPDVLRDDSGLWVTGKCVAGRGIVVQAFITTNMLEEIRGAGGRVSAAWIAVIPEVLTNRGIEDGQENLFVRGKVIGLRARKL